MRRRISNMLLRVATMLAFTAVATILLNVPQILRIMHLSAPSIVGAGKPGWEREPREIRGLTPEEVEKAMTGQVSGVSDPEWEE